MGAASPSAEAGAAASSAEAGAAVPAWRATVDDGRRLRQAAEVRFLGGGHYEADTELTEAEIAAALVTQVSL